MASDHSVSSAMSLRMRRKFGTVRLAGCWPVAGLWAATEGDLGTKGDQLSLGDVGGGRESCMLSAGNKGAGGP